LYPVDISVVVQEGVPVVTLIARTKVFGAIFSTSKLQCGPIGRNFAIWAKFFGGFFSKMSPK
jgi:hypothetical protein